MDKEFHPTHYNGCNYLSMLGLQWMHGSKRDHWWESGRNRWMNTIMLGDIAIHVNCQIGIYYLHIPDHRSHASLPMICEIYRVWVRGIWFCWYLCIYRTTYGLIISWRITVVAVHDHLLLESAIRVKLRKHRLCIVNDSRYNLWADVFHFLTFSNFITRISFAFAKTTYKED